VDLITSSKVLNPILLLINGRKMKRRAAGKNFLIVMLLILTIFGDPLAGLDPTRSSNVENTPWIDQWIINYPMSLSQFSY